MEKKQFENSDFVLYSPDSLKYITNSLESNLSETIEFYKRLFDIDEFRQVQINYFDDIEKFRQFIYELRGENTSLPSYATGTFDNGMINTFIPSDIIESTPLYYKKLYMASHELFHIMYQELIWQRENMDRVIWFDEGMAQFFSGEKRKMLNDDNFNIWLMNVIESTKEIPNLNLLTHGNSFENEKYSGYNLSLLAVKYLFETLGIDSFKLLMHDTDKIKSYGNIIIKEAFEYYKKNRKE